MDVLNLVARAAADEFDIDPDNLNTTTTDPALISAQKDFCEVGKCPPEWQVIDYRPSPVGNSIYAFCFFLLIFPQLFFGIKNKTWMYLTVVTLGVVGEMVGYGGRLLLFKNPFLMNNFLMNLIPLTLAPAFLTGGIYMCLGRVITVIGAEFSRIKPKWYTIIFVAADLLSLILQGAGGGIAATADDQDGSDMGVNIMIAGLISQVVSMSIFLAVWGDFAIRVRKAKISGALLSNQPPLYEDLRKNRTFSFFQWSLFIATVLIYVRCVFRVAELWEGFDGHLANHELTFMIFEGPFIISAVAAMTAFHPGRVFGKLWVPAGKGVRTAAKWNQDSASSIALTGGEEQWKDNTAYQRV